MQSRHFYGDYVMADSVVDKVEEYVHWKMI